MVSITVKGGLGKEEYPGVCIRPILRNFQGGRPGYLLHINQGSYFFDLFRFNWGKRIAQSNVQTDKTFCDEARRISKI